MEGSNQKDLLVTDFNKDIVLNNPKMVRAWSFYDWANSAYNLIITSAIFPSYYTGIIQGDKVELLGQTFDKAAAASWSISIAFLIIAFISPLLGAYADYKGNKKSFMRFFCALGALACMGLFFFKKDVDTGLPNVGYGLFCSIVACIGYCGSIVFYNAYLPEIADKENQDKVSAKGFVMGYIGSVLLLAICLSLILGMAQFNKDHNQVLVRLSFLLVGVWWLGWSIIPFTILPKGKPIGTLEGSSVWSIGYQQIGNVFKEVVKNSLLLKYLAAFFFSNMGVQTTMYMATYFAAKEIKMETQQLIITVLLIQLIAIGGAYLTSYLSKKIGNFKVLLILALLWITVCLLATFVVYNVNQFYGLASLVGLIMGGSQSLARSTYSKLIPTGTQNNASYFSFYDVVEKLSIVIGTATFGLVANLTGMRMSALALGCYFVISVIILLFILNQNKVFLKKD